MRALSLVLMLCTTSLACAERSLPAAVISGSQRAETRDDYSPVRASQIAEGHVTSMGSDGGGIPVSPPIAGPSARVTQAPGAINTVAATVAPAYSRSESGAATSGRTLAPLCADCAEGLQHSHGERSRLEAEKELLTLQIDIATLRKRLDELQTTPRAVTGRTRVPMIAEPPPTVLSRRGFDGHSSALLRMSTGGNVVVHAGDKLPFGRIDAIDGAGVLVTWYGRQVRLLDAEVEESSSGTGPTSRNLDLSLPVAPAAVSAR